MVGLILAAAGSGSRFGSETPKQFTRSGGTPLYLLALRNFSEFIDQAVIVLPAGWKEEVEQQIAVLPYRDRLILEPGGPQRQDSVYRGLLRFSQEFEFILVHDAARPFTSPDLIGRVLEATRRYRACVPVIPVADTIKEVRSGRLVRTLDRNSLGRVQTPQGFSANLLRKAFLKAEADGFYGTDESSLVERLGITVHCVPGEASNSKVTWESDL